MKGLLCGKQEHRTAEPNVLPRLSVVITSPSVAMVRWLQAVMAGIAMLALGLAAWWWQESQIFETEAARLEVATTRTESLTAQLKAQMAREGLTMSTEQVTRVRMDVVFLNQLVEKRAFSWVQLLSDLEAAVPLSVSISSVKVNFQESTVSLSGVSKDLQSLNTFVTNLQSHPAFREATLVNHHVHEDDAAQGRPVSRAAATRRVKNEIDFSLAVQYRLGTEAVK